MFTDALLSVSGEYAEDLRRSETDQRDGAARTDVLIFGFAFVVAVPPFHRTLRASTWWYIELPQR